MKHQAPFVWLDATGQGRHLNVYFRFDFRLSGPVKRAQINLFADSRYHLKVNGTHLGFGPARFLSDFAEYDRYDIAPYLKKGKNVIAVQVVAHGLSTFMCELNQGGFTSWGAVECADGKRIDLSTPGKWVCRKANGYDQNAPVFSFTSSAIDIFDARKDVPDWDAPGRDLKGWRPVVVVDKQNAWARLRPRSIPHLTQEERVPKILLGAYPLTDEEQIVSFRLPKGDWAKTRAELRGVQKVFAYTYIHSPRKQNVRTGLFWGSHHVNGGAEMKPVPPTTGKHNRQERILRLKKGWNFFFISYGICETTWEFHMAVPKTARLHFSATKKRNSKFMFMTAGPFTPEENEALEKVKIPFRSPEDLPELSRGWEGVERTDVVAGPSHHMAWCSFGPKTDIEQTQVGGLSVNGKHGSALVYDMGHETLGRIFVDFQAPRGTVVDVGWSESMHGERPAILKRCMIYEGERHIARGGTGRLETFKPRGLRYLQVNITQPKATCSRPGPVRVDKVGVVQQIYPFEKVGRFECSDPMFNDIWELGWRTLRMCSEDAYTDCPWRERHLYAGDMLPEFAATLATSGDTRLAARCLRLLAPRSSKRLKDDAGQSLTDYPLMALLIYGWCVERSGDARLAREHYPAYRDLLSSFLTGRRDKGLFWAKRAFIDWIAIEKTGNLTTMHALLAAAFQALARVARRIGRRSDATKLDAEAGRIARLTRKRFWDPEAGAYRDGFVDGKPIDSHFPASSAWPSLFGLTSPMQEAQIRDHYRRTLARPGGEKNEAQVSSYGGFHVLGAMYRHGHTDLAEWFMRNAWGMFVQAGADTAWEVFPIREKDGTPGISSGWSLCHAWSAGPTYYLSACTLGVDMGFPVSSDPKRLVIAPQSESLSWARGVVPHPAGPVEVDWRVDGDLLRVECDVPKGVRWSVQPRGKLAEKKLVVNGK